MGDNNLKNNTTFRNILRLLGPIVLILGIVFLGVAIRDFFVGFNNSTTFGEPQNERFHYAFIGMPLIFVGGAMTSFGYMGSVLRYQASQVAPVGKDVVNYMLDNTKDSASGFAKAIRSDKAVLHCVNCSSEVSQSDKFCNECGASLAKSCPKCKAMSPQKSKYCNECGYDIR